MLLCRSEPTKYQVIGDAAKQQVVQYLTVQLFPKSNEQTVALYYIHVTVRFAKSDKTELIFNRAGVGREGCLGLVRAWLLNAQSKAQQSSSLNAPARSM